MGFIWTLDFHFKIPWCVTGVIWFYISYFQDDVIQWKYVSRYWPFVRGIHRSPVNSSHKSQWCGALMFSLICDWLNGWVNNQDADDLRGHHAHNDVTVMWSWIVIQWSGQPWDLSAFNASLLSNFELVKRVKLGGFVHYGRNGLKFGTLLYPDCVENVSIVWRHHVTNGGLVCQQITPISRHE